MTKNRRTNAYTITCTNAGPGRYATMVRHELSQTFPTRQLVSASDSRKYLSRPLATGPFREITRKLANPGRYAMP